MMPSTWSCAKVLFRKFVADGAAAVWKPDISHMQSSRLLRLRTLPTGYAERRLAATSGVIGYFVAEALSQLTALRFELVSGNLPDTYVWAARRSLAKL